MPTVIACAGMIRSGSTWQYNAVRLLLKAAGRSAKGFWIEDYDPEDGAEVHIVKMHSAIDAEAIRPDTVLSTVRDPRAVLASLARMGWTSLEEDRLRTQARDYADLANHWQSIADVTTRYADIIERPVEAMTSLNGALDLGLPQSTLAAIADQLDAIRAPEDADSTSRGYHAESLLHPGHIGDRTDAAAVALLPPGIAEAIADEIRPWMKEHGFE
ncbi:MAG: hypothetical protein EBR82_05620 [Caulobacteraceae bacterium]|nr:hypothetical protein [Caulobacteraceae bacterium]